MEEKEDKSVKIQSVLSSDYKNGRFIFYEREKPDETKEGPFMEEARKMILSPNKDKELSAQLNDLVKKHGMKGKVSVEQAMDEPETYRLVLRNRKGPPLQNGKAVKGDHSLDNEYLSMDGDMDDSINDSMEIQGPLSRSTKEYLKRTARQMRQIDSEIGMAVNNGDTEQALLLTNQWDLQRSSMLYYLRSSRIRVNPGKKKNKKKIVTKALDNEEKNEKKRGIHRKKSRGMERERVRFPSDGSY